MDGKIDDGIELSDIGTKQKSDDNDMARLGKTPVLKAVITSLCLSSALTFLCSGISDSCQFWASAVRYSLHGKGF